MTNLSFAVLSDFYYSSDICRGQISRSGLEVVGLTDQTGPHYGRRAVLMRCNLMPN